MSGKRTGAWRVWAKALGEKASKCDNESDRVAVVRTLILTTYLLTNLFIVAGVVRHWGDGRSHPANRPTAPPHPALVRDMIVE